MTNVDLGPSVVNITGMVEHDAWSLALTLTSGSAAYDLTGLSCTAKMTVGSVQYPITVTVTNAAAGLVTLSMASAPAIFPSPGVWALRAGSRTLIEGTVTGIDDVLD